MRTIDNTPTSTSRPCWGGAIGDSLDMEIGGTAIEATNVPNKATEHTEHARFRLFASLPVATFEVEQTFSPTI